MSDPYRRFAFSLRTMFVGLTLAVTACWAGYYLGWIIKRHNALLGANVEWEGHNAPGTLGVFGEKHVLRIRKILPAGDLEAEHQRLNRLFPECHSVGVVRACSSPSWQPNYPPAKL